MKFAIKAYFQKLGMKFTIKAQALNAGTAPESFNSKGWGADFTDKRRLKVDLLHK